MTMTLTETRPSRPATAPGQERTPAARLNQAWQWLDEQRNNAPDSAGVWHIRHRHATDGAYLTDLLHTLEAGEYRLFPMQLHGTGDSRKAMWGAQDALVLKWLALSIAHQLSLHPACEHVKGHGGGKQSIAKLHDLLMQPAEPEKKMADEAISQAPDTARGYRWVCRTDIRGYYRNINKDTLFAQVKHHVSDPVMQDLVHQYLHYTVEDGGTFHTPETGISRGCALSPLMGALHLYDMDAHFSAQKNIHYARYMDDIIILAKTRWSLRRHTKRLMKWFNEYGFEAHPDKTQIGKTEKGFDWMGAWLTHDGVTDIAPRAKANHREKVRRLYEQLARVPKWLRRRRQQQVHARVSTYRKRWNIWAGALLSLCAASTAFADRPIVVLSPTLPPGTSVLPGGNFTATGIYNGTTNQNAPSNTYRGIAYISGSNTGPSQVGSTWGGLTWGVGVPGTNYYGVRSSNGLYLVPVTGSYFELLISGQNAASGHVPVVNTNNALIDCDGITAAPGATGNRIFICGSPGYVAYVNIPQGGPELPVGATIQGKYNLIFEPVCSSCTPGVTNITVFNFGLYFTIPRATAIDKPTEIVVSGLSCNLTGPIAPLDIGGVAKKSTANQLTGTTSFPLTITCTGTNTTEQVVPVSINFTPTGDTTATTNQFRVASQPSFFSTIAENTAACSGATKMQLGAGTSNLWHTYAANEAGKAYTKNLVWALCSTGDTTQAPGNYSMTMTASIVSY